MSCRRTLVAALAWCGALLALLVLVPASAIAATAGGDEFSLSDLVPLGSAVLGGALAAGTTLGVARKTANAQLQQAAGTLMREQQERMAMDMQTIAEQAASLYDRLLNAVENGMKEGVGPITQAIIDLSRRRHFIVDPELRKRTNEYLKVAAEILQTEDRTNARELARDAGRLADSISERAGALYVQAMGATDLSSGPAQGREEAA